MCCELHYISVTNSVLIVAAVGNRGSLRTLASQQQHPSVTIGQEIISVGSRNDPKHISTSLKSQFMESVCAFLASHCCGVLIKPLPGVSCHSDNEGCIFPGNFYC